MRIFSQILKFFPVIISNIVLTDTYALEANVNCDPPIEKKEIDVGKSLYSDSMIKRNCYKYSDYIVVEEVDSGQKGATLIGLESNKNYTSLLNVCKKKNSSFKLK